MHRFCQFVQSNPKRLRPIACYVILSSEIFPQLGKLLP